MILSLHQRVQIAAWLRALAQRLDPQPVVSTTYAPTAATGVNGSANAHVTWTRRPQL